MTRKVIQEKYAIIPQTVIEKCIEKCIQNCLEIQSGMFDHKWEESGA